MRRGRKATLRLRINGGRGTALPIPIKKARFISLSRRPGEGADLSGMLPPGQGNPDDYTAQGPPNAGGAGFTSYWPLAQGARATITEGPNGPYSHSTVYTKDAVDLGVPAGTEIHAGFTGVVARTSTGCGVGDARCGAGYGNYIYLKASDGTCAVMAHLSQINVSPGQQVAQYDVLGLSGNTGNSTGAHLHYDHVDCNNNSSLAWTPVEGGSLAEGATIVSQNHPDTQQPPPPPPPPPPETVPETTGGATDTWTNYQNAGGEQGPTIPANATVAIRCKIQGFKVQDGNTWWYKIASDPWHDKYYASADAFYNNGQTSGDLRGTPFVDEKVPNC